MTHIATWTKDSYTKRRLRYHMDFGLKTKGGKESTLFKAHYRVKLSLWVLILDKSHYDESSSNPCCACACVCACVSLVYFFSRMRNPKELYVQPLTQLSNRGTGPPNQSHPIPKAGQWKEPFGGLFRWQKLRTQQDNQHNQG